MRIFLPRRSARSSTATRRPRLPASMAHINPAAPPPRMSASREWVITGSHVEQAEARQAVFIQKALVDVLLLQLLDLGRGHFSAVGREFAIGLRADRDDVFIRRGGEQRSEK